MRRLQTIVAVLWLSVLACFAAYNHLGSLPFAKIGEYGGYTVTGTTVATTTTTTVPGIAVFVFDGTNVSGLVEDQTPNGFDATPNNVSFADNGTNSWADLSGAAGLLTVEDQSMMPTGSSFSIRCWVYPIADPQEVWGDDAILQANKGHHLSLQGDEKFGVREAYASGAWGVEIVSGVVSLNAWYMLTFTRPYASGQPAKFWVNKAYIGSHNTLSAFDYTPTYPMQIGDSGKTNAGGRHFTGRVGYWEVVTNLYSGADVTNYYDTEVVGY